MQYDLHASEVTLFASDGVTAKLAPCKLKGGRALRLDYQFKGAGHTLIRVPVALELPGNYRFSFSVKGQAPANTLEFKCVDPSGENVWWVNRPNFQVSPRWQTLVNKKRHFTYAWGPVNEPLTKVGFLELTVSATSGGRGTIYFADLSFEKLADEHSELPPVVIRASSARADSHLIDTGSGLPPGQDGERGWRSSRRERQYLHLDFGTMREFDGLTIDFGYDYACDYEVQILAGRRWRTVDRIIGGARMRQYHSLPECQSSSLRLVFSRSSEGRGYEVMAINIKPTGFASTTSKFFANVASDLPAGFSPRYFQNEQSFWTVVGVSGGREKAIINEEGMIEPALQAPVLEPFISTQGKLLTWKDGQHVQSLVEGYLPLPVVERKHDSVGLDLKIEALAQGPQDSSTLYCRYTVKNGGVEAVKGSLFVALRHYQVNPPWQFLNTPGGFTPVYSLRGESGGIFVVVNDKQKIVSQHDVDSFAVSQFCRGEIVELMARGDFSQKVTEAASSISVVDSRGYCSAALEYKFSLDVGEEVSFALALPYNDQSKIHPFEQARELAIAQWREQLQPVDIDLPAHPELVNTIKSQLAYILINRDGQALQPGSRCYRRTWIRDGSLTSEALLQLGLKAEVRKFIDWFAPYQYPDGKVPCCVDKRGADPTPEHDSHGEFIYLVVEYYRYSKDRAFLRRLFPQLLAAVDYINGLRSQRLTDVYKSAEKAHLYGLLPESISHEGYSAKPAHSYWDDLFALKGLGDALFAARELAQSDPAILPAVQKVSTIYDAFRHDLVASMKASMVKWGIDYIPGAADRGDFDPTSTTIALDPCDLSEELAPELAATFAAYWRFFNDRRDGKLQWHAYTPYEWRSVGTLARLGQVEKAHQAMAYFMNDRRPHGWNHWAEVIFKDPRTPGFIGDAPHGWVGSDFLRAVRTLFVYEKTGSLVVAPGLPLSWLDAGLDVRNMATEYGTFSLSVRGDKKSGGGSSLTYELSGEIDVPVELVVPAANAKQKSGVGDDFVTRTITIQNLPATVEIDLD